MSKHQKHNNPTNNQTALRDLTFGDFDSGYLLLPHNEAALIVMDKKATIAAMLDPSIDPFVCAVAGPEECVIAEKRKYENDPKYQIYYFPEG